jgi:hypothetical protein
VLHFLRAYCGLNVAETATIGDGVVMLWGKKFATLHWERDVPVFGFETPEHNEAQERLCIRAVQESLPNYPNNVPGWMMLTIEALRRVGMGDAAQAYCNDRYKPKTMGRVIARDMGECCKRVEHWITDDPRVETREDFLRAIECGVAALRETGNEHEDKAGVL